MPLNQYHIKKSPKNDFSCGLLTKSLQKIANGDVEVAALGGLDYIIGDLWTSGQRQGHSIHEISYRACFKPQLPELLINLLTKEQDIVLDPFLGRGTTAIQAGLMNRIAYGSDSNPLSVILTEPRLNAPAIADVQARLLEMPKTARIKKADEELLVFFHPKVLGQLTAMKKWFIKRDNDGIIDSIDKWIRMVATNRLTGHSPGFFSVKTMPPNQAVSARTQHIINQKHGLYPEEKDVASLILKKSKSLLRDGGMARRDYKLSRADATSLSYIKDKKVNIIITSPPFLDVVNYHHDNWLRGWFNGISPKNVKISSHNKITDWADFVRQCFKEFSRVVKRGGYVAFEVGEARNGEVLLEQVVADATRGLPFALIAVIINKQQFTKTANCWGVKNNEKGTNTNRIVLFRRK